MSHFRVSPQLLDTFPVNVGGKQWSKFVPPVTNDLRTGFEVPKGIGLWHTAKLKSQCFQNKRVNLARPFRGSFQTYS